MKKYIIIVLLLAIVGSVLGIFVFKENQQIEESLHVETTQAIRKMKILDNQLNVLLFKSRYGLEKNYDNIAKTFISLRKEYDNLKSTILFEEINRNEELKRKFIKYDEQLVIKKDLVESFKTNNAVLINSSNYMLVLGGLVFDIAKLMEDVKAKDYIANINLAVYKFLMTEDIDSKQYIQASFTDLQKYEPSLEDYENVLFAEYILHLKTILERREETQNYLVRAVEQPTNKVLNELEATYINYHNTILEKSSGLRNALIIYGLILLAALLLLTGVLSKHYQDVGQQAKQFEEAYKQLLKQQNSD